MSLIFPKGFLWGSATSAPQFEGASSIGGKSEMVWDYWFSTSPERFHGGVGPERTSDFYHHFETDIENMKKINMNSLRTSISWARLLPDGERINDEAVSFYREVFKSLIANNIKPIVNLYHFDMPLRLHLQGGWENKEVVYEFAYYAKTAFELFGDLVSDWVTFNEPMVPIEMGYLNDKHLPAIYDLKRAVKAAFHTMLAHSHAVKQFKEVIKEGRIGLILNLTPTYPKSSEPEDVQAANWADLFFNRSFLDPAVKGEYPVELITWAKQIGVLPEYESDDVKVIKENPIDFLGVNYYQPKRAQRPVNKDHTSVLSLHHYFEPYVWPGRKMNPHRGWEIYEQGLYDIAINIRDHYGNIPWYVAENGMGVEGEEQFLSESGEVQDDYRIEFITNHLEWLHKGITEGSNCFGYHVWTFVDNWSWLNAYKNRYGLFRLDITTQERHTKKSGMWFRELAASNHLQRKMNDECSTDG